MHSLRATSTVYRFRIAALLFCAQAIVGSISIGVVIPSYMVNNRELATYALFGLLLAILITILLWMMAGRTNCPLCMTPVLAKKACSKHNRAKTAFGSYRLRVALSILFKNSFTCPYCLESTAVRVRVRSKVMSRR